LWYYNITKNKGDKKKWISVKERWMQKLFSSFLLFVNVQIVCPLKRVKALTAAKISRKGCSRMFKKLQYKINDKAIRLLMIKLGQYAAEWQEPYDDKDYDTRRHNEPIEAKWDYCLEFLEELLKE
jgi:hypothetical protein